MTPLAHKFMKQFTLPLKRRDPRYTARPEVRGVLSDFHCFECSEVAEIALNFCNSSAESPPDGTLFFLPAPRTWIEWKAPETGNRMAVYMVEGSGADDGEALVYFFKTGIGGPLFGYIPLNSAEWGRLSLPGAVSYDAMCDDPKTQIQIQILNYSRFFLPLINTPRIIGRRQHMPNRAMEKKLSASFGVGKFPLHAWTEIKLEVSKPTEIDDGMPHEAHLTGKRALHFCRAHIRIRNGVLEYVRSHWRGDPAIGIKQSRYKLVA